MKLVYSFIAREYPTYMGDEDLIQTGMVGLCQAAETWDENRGKFSSFAYICIRNAICKEFRSRNKHQGVWSLDYVITNENGEVGSFGDCVVGDEDVGYVDTVVNIDKLNEKERKVYELLLDGVEPLEISKQLGISHQYVYATRRKMRKLKG
jgi:DNA-directed RNA polymerase specialized sigma subunit